jgi:hypothetical protein
VLDLQLSDGLGVDLRLVAGPVVGHDSLDGDALGGEPGDGTAEEPDTGHAGLVVEDLDVGQAAGVVDGDVAVVPAVLAGPVAAVAGLA